MKYKKTVRFSPICNVLSVVMSDVLNLEFRYRGKLAKAPLEQDPAIHFWTSTVRSGTQGETCVKVNWDDESKQISETHVVSVPLGNVKQLREDDMVRMEAIVQSPNYTGRHVGAHAGAAGFYFRDIYDALEEEGKFENEFELRMPQLIVQGKPYLKGRLYVRVTSQAQSILDEWKFTPVEPYHLVEANEKPLQKYLESSVDISVFPYTEGAKSIGAHFPPTTDHIGRIHAPVWQNVVATPGFAYWINYTDYAADEPFMSNLAKVALARYHTSPQWFVDTVDKQFARGDADAYNEDFTMAAAFTAGMLVLPSVSLSYKGDETYTFSRGLFSSNTHNTSIEAFSDALRLNGGDCEDVANLIGRVARMLEWGRPELADKTVLWMKKGGWTDPVLQRMQRIAHIYVGVGSLGSVTSQRLEQTMFNKDDENNGYKPLIINSREDNESQIGAHMWWEWIPLARFEVLMNIANSSKPFSLYPNEKRADWEHKIPHLVGEGTGWLYPLILPREEHFTGKSHRIQARRDHEKRLLVYKQILPDARFLNFAQVEQYPKLVKDIPEARLSDFYRRTGSAYTDKFFNEGWNFGEFMWTHLPSRQSSGIGARSSSKGEWSYGVNMRYKLLNSQVAGSQAESRESPDFEKVALLTVPGLFDEERETIRSLLRQLPPQRTPQITSERRKNLNEHAMPAVEDFQKAADEITGSRRPLRDPNRRDHINLILRGPEFFLGALEGYGLLRKGILEDIAARKDIYDVKTAFEIITDDIYNVCVTLYVNVDDTRSYGHVGESMRHPVVSTLNVQCKDLNEGKRFDFSSKERADAFFCGLEDKEPDVEWDSKTVACYATAQNYAQAREHYDISVEQCECEDRRSNSMLYYEDESFISERI